MTDIADPTPADDIIDHQERVEAVIDERIASSASGAQQPLRIAAGVDSTWVSEGGRGALDLCANTPGDQLNVLSGSLPLAVMPSNRHLGRLYITVPELPAGVLTLRTAALAACSADGTNALSMGLNDALILTEPGFQVITLDSADFDFNAVGTDVTYDGTGHMHTTAGGVYSVGWYVELVWAPA